MIDEKELTHIDLFSGIGGFTLAGEWAGFRTIVFCEKEEFCQKVLQERFGAVIADPKSAGRTSRTSKRQPRRCNSIPLIPEIRDFDGKKYQEATLLTGGFPCQPFSVAGQRRGKEDDRYLWPEMLRVISEAKPRWILAENVPGIFRLALDTVLADLEGEGYATGTFIIPACGLNAPHRRNRVWIVANSRCQHGEGAENRGKFKRPIFQEENALEPERPIEDDEPGDAQNPIGTGAGNQGGKINDQEGRISKDRRESIRQKDGKIGAGRPTPTDKYASDSSSKRLEGRHNRNKGIKKKSNGLFSSGPNSDAWEKDWYEVAARFCRVDDGVPDRIHRLKALGNAIVPQIAYEILKNIAWIERNE